MTATSRDPALFAALTELASAPKAVPGLRQGWMFGCPALYVGRRMCACVLGKQVGLRVPAALANAARASGRGRHFTPYGRRPMLEWVALDLPPDQLHHAEDLIAAAVRFAKVNDEHAP